MFPKVNASEITFPKPTAEVKKVVTRFQLTSLGIGLVAVASSFVAS